MFCTTLRRRPSLSTLIHLLTSSTNPKFLETELQTHDLALPFPPQDPQPTHQQRPTTQLFLILTPSSLHDPKTTERIIRFSTLTATPPPTILFLLSTSDQPTTNNLPAFMALQTQLHPLSNPPPLLPIPSPPYLLRTLQTYTTAPTPAPAPAPPLPALILLPSITTTAPLQPLSTHTTHVLSDLCCSLKEVAVLCETERGRRVLGEWLGEEEGRGVVGFWEGEWVVE
ncbi:hypothetical protein IMSHALPRED_001731 [Imshaugia aleurites]|uniref:Uncharacterized protein n=1 Tax=Imshaugia aleurites TaxID=172621 RepID=A0A8H3PGV5_9LECA|nr:hypothetical protein IMSHALPRED_001731 [Imshaugia aleurites]